MELVSYEYLTIRSERAIRQFMGAARKARNLLRRQECFGGATGVFLLWEDIVTTRLAHVDPDGFQVDRERLLRLSVPSRGVTSPQDWARR